ncbi:hypothetical protein [Planctomicrobium sp. SH664]|uniref:prenyltransferase/squalene oxidase repeat-containing protein n=1 Tax=Planctomicrobium sp. SH664 TaxID=3448125 RepID=UPI003F5BFF0F
MTLAAVNLNQESWHLARLTIALLQPALVMILICGLVLATAHLLTMLGTRWGDRRVTSKSLFFSFSVHLLLACGLIALIPESHPRIVYARVNEIAREPVQVVSIQSRSDSPGTEDTVQGDLPEFERMLQHAPSSNPPVTPFPERTANPSATASPEVALNKPGDMARFEPQPTPDLNPPLQPPDSPLPDRQQSGETSALPQANANLNVESMASQVRQQTQSAATQQRERTPSPQAKVDDLVVPERPFAGNLIQPSIDTSPSPTVPYMEILPAPTVERPDPEGKPAVPTQASIATTVPEQIVRPPEDRPPAGSEDREIARMETRTLTETDTGTGLSGARARVEPNAPPSPATNANPSASLSASAVPAEMPTLSRQADPFLSSTGADRVPSAYRLRTEEQRERAILRFGGSAETEAAVDRSLKWLSKVQHPDGYWDASEFGAGQVEVAEAGVNRQTAGKDADVGVTALAVLAFLGKLNTIDQGEYAPVVRRALHWIVSQQTVHRWKGDWGETNGYLGGNASDFEAMYCHGMATFALAEAYAMSRDKPEAQWLRTPLEKAIHFIFDTQIADGGWRYVKGQPDGDMSMFGWQLMAIKSAEAAGIPIPEDVKAKMRRFLSERRRGEAYGLAGYRAMDPPTASMTAEALYCRQMMGMAQDPESNREAVQFLLQHPPRRSTLNLYYWYYGTLAMYQHGGREWDQWNKAVRDLLVAEQRQSGPLAGSWDPRDLWGGYGGRVYSTAIATLNLEVYYRYLPLYRLQETE